MYLGIKDIRTSALVVALVALLAMNPTGSSGQATPTGSTPPPEPSRFDLFGGYGYYHPVASDINNIQYQPDDLGTVDSVTGYFNRFIGFQVEGSIFRNAPTANVGTAEFGPVFRFQKGRFFPFAHVLGGGARVGGPANQPGTWGYGFTGGAGTDFVLPMFGNRIAIRPIQADFTYSHVDYGKVLTAFDGGVGKITAYRLSSGIVLRLGEVKSPPAVQLGCTAQPVDVYPGDPLTVTAVPANLAGKKKATYVWATSGGKITGTEESASVTTAGLAAGDYTITGRVYDGYRSTQQAECTAGFRVHAFEPPTLSCSTSPTSVLSGQPVTITATGHSPQNRILTYSYTATAGQVSGSGSTATLSTVGVAPGTATIGCNVVDDLGQRASATTPVAITAPPPPPAPLAQSLCSVSFDRDKKRPVRVDNEAKGCLDEVALTLNRDSTAKLVIVGHHDAGEQPEAAAERALNVAQYLTDAKGIDRSRLELRTGDGQARSVENTMLPAGAMFDPGNTATFDTGSIQRHGQPYATPQSPSTGTKKKTGPTN